ncbi:FhaA domain-containing protein, partial [Rhodococcus sp. NPDC058514]|uniref:FhaA domain-containing protein n=1 Tax=Rhodococcus sp. NPDC058514 TaxID=3346532 RepID=UPI00365E1C73
MGIVQRFERKLQGAVGDAFARVFGGGVMPQEVESALQQEATDRVQQLDGGHLLAPNSYVITINGSDHDELATDRDLTVKAFARHLEGFIRDQGWQTYGPITVRFEPSHALHTGQFRTSGTVDPDAGRPPARSPGPDVHAVPLPRPSAHPNPGAGPMTQNSGYDANREPADNEGRPEYQPAYASNGYANGNSYPSEQPRNGYASEQPRNGYERPYGGGYQDPYAPGGSDPYAQSGNDPYAQGGNDPYAQGGYQQGAPAYPPQQSPAYPPQQGSGYPAQQAPQGYDYQQNAYGQEYPSYDQQPYGGGGYSGFDADRTFTVTLQLEDGSGRNFQLREGRNVIGRGQEAQFRLPDTGVSRRHIEIRWDGQVAMLSDLGSTNGTTVNGAPVQDWQLADGDVIRAGNSEILV